MELTKQEAIKANIKLFVYLLEAAGMHYVQLEHSCQGHMIDNKRARLLAVLLTVSPTLASYLNLKALDQFVGYSSGHSYML